MEGKEGLFLPALRPTEPEGREEKLIAESLMSTFQSFCVRLYRLKKHNFIINFQNLILSLLSIALSYLWAVEFHQRDKFFDEVYNITTSPLIGVLLPK